MKRGLKYWLQEFNYRATRYALNVARRAALLDDHQIWVKRPAYIEKSVGLKNLGGQKVRCWQVLDSRGDKLFRVDDTFSFLPYRAPTFGVS